MRFLVDTHIFLFLINADEKLDKDIINTLENPSNSIHLSIASLWEIVVKVNIGKLPLTRNINELYELLNKKNIIVLNIQKQHLDIHLSLPLIHKDPFDGLIISQAIADDLTLITDDQNIKNYPNLKIFK